METPPLLEITEKIEYSTPRRSAILALKKYAGDKLSNNKIFRQIGVSKHTGYRIMKAEPMCNKEALSWHGWPRILSAEHLK
jgi:transposase